MPFRTNASPYDLANLNILVVDDQEDVRRGLKRLIASLGCNVEISPSAEDALKIMSESSIDIVFTDLKMDGMSGEELLKIINQKWTNVVVVLITGQGTIELAVECLRNGASHFITKPFDNKEILKFVEGAGYRILAEKLAAQRTQQKKNNTIIAVDTKMKEVLELAEKVAKQKVPVLIEGASGTGKELIAHEIHNQSPVSNKPFLAINCIALPDTLLDSELFGYKKGAFTGALKDTAGIFEQANGGTVFLDEVSSMSPLFQGKLLRVLQEKKIRPLGQSNEFPVDFRIISASNKNLLDLVEKGEFREDLYYRLQVVKISIPTLNQRKDCIPALAEFFLKKTISEFFYKDYPTPAFSPAAMEALQNHNWSGNVRELENTIQRALIIQKGNKILPSHLGLKDTSLISESLLVTSYEASKQEVLENFQRKYILNLLERTNGNISKASEMCGLTRAALQRIIKKLGLEKQ
ncbi:sigma-54-dependent Fis family transcriptional regulator [bacterium]|nr:sigma-54-dependent Fis family transcriptional regulator [bacterium]